MSERRNLLTFRRLPTRSGLLRGAAATFAAATVTGWARGASAAFPERLLRIVVPVSPGGNLDMVTRAVAEPLAKMLGQPVVVDNKPGASSLVGTQLVAKSPPDGYTLLSIANTFASVPALVASPGYDPVRDFVGITLTCRIPMVLLVHPAVPVRSVAEFIALARAKPGEITYATAGSGSTGHIAAELFSRAAGVRLTMVPYKGNAQAALDLVGGQVMAMFDQVSTAAPYVQAGKLRALGVTTKTRAVIFPDVPTIDSAGLPGYEDVTFNGLLAPAGTPAELISALHAAVVRVLSADELRAKFAERGIELAASASSDEFTQFIAAESRKYATLARESGMKAD
jgi:putative tricarboxylic transport membrane protein